jgi:phosphatidylglycerol---prolipoprotein diacylglyceryl transferase
VGPAVISFAFDPVLKLGDTASVRIETLALAAVLFIGIAMAARIGRLTPTVGPFVPAPTLRPDDLVFIVVGAVPGAIIGGRLGYVLAHYDYYLANTSLIVDPRSGGFELTLAVPFAVLTGAIIARLVGASVVRWMHAVAFPLLFVLAAGKLVGVLGANGQGNPADLPWATAYTGPGPWDSLGANVASHPSQVYEAGLVLVAIVVLAAISRWEVISRRDGAALFAAVGLWAIARFVVAFTWRDAIVVGPFRIEQVLLLVLIALSGIGLIERQRAPLATLEEEEELLDEDELEA